MGGRITSWASDRRWWFVDGGYGLYLMLRESWLSVVILCAVTIVWFAMWPFGVKAQMPFPLPSDESSESPKSESPYHEPIMYSTGLLLSWLGSREYQRRRVSNGITQESVEKTIDKKFKEHDQGILWEIQKKLDDHRLIFEENLKANEETVRDLMNTLSGRLDNLEETVNGGKFQGINPGLASTVERIAKSVEQLAEEQRKGLQDRVDLRREFAQHRHAKEE